MAVTPITDYPLPLALFERTTEPSTPAADTVVAYLDDADGHLKLKDESDVVTDLAGAPTKHWCRAVRTTSQTIPTDTVTAIAFDAADVADTDGYHDPSSANTRITIPTGLGGLYLIQGAVPWAASATGSRLASFRLNGSTIIGIIHDFAYSAGIDAANHVSGSTMYELAPTDYVEIVVYQNSGGNRDVISADAGPWFAVSRLAA